LKLNYKAVIFDMDGTLIDAQDWHYLAFNEALEIFGLSIPPDEHQAKFDGLPTRVKLQMLTDEGRLPKHLHSVVSEVKQERTLRYVSSRAFPRVEQLLMMSWLKKNDLKIAVATNSIKSSAQTMLASVGILPFLDVLVSNEDVSRAKPDPEMYELTANLLGLDPSECLVIEDHELGVQAGVAAGCNVHKVNSVEELDQSLMQNLVAR
jgi:beta-phosphoglucomutase-like phosphatase (HAD superfamily)